MTTRNSKSPDRRPTRVATWRIGAIAALAMLVGCGDGGKGGSDDDVVLDPAKSTLVYRFNDSSVPPEYHRSYTLRADAESATLVVDSYGDVLHDVTESVAADAWQSALDASEGLSNVPDVTSGGCTGGTSEELRVLDAQDQPVIDVFVDHCSSSSGPDLDEVVADMLTLFDLDVLLATG